MRRAPRESRMFSSTARYSRASSCASGGRLRLGDRVDLDPERLPGAGHARADRRPLLSAHNGGAGATRELAGLEDLRR